jgi:hypothetical protein
MSHRTMTGVRKAATILVQTFQRTWPPVFLGVALMLEVVWMFFLAYASIRLVFTGGL